jgi:type IV pilus assembly protein PilW
VNPRPHSHPPSRPRRAAQAGLSLVELMISVTIGLLLLSGLVTLFVNSSDAERESRRASQQIENGRYAIDVLSQDVRLSGYFGAYRKYTTPTALPDACATAVATLQADMGLPVQGYQAASLASVPAPAASCAAWLSAANLSPGSDILVLRRAETVSIAPGDATTAGEVYLQANPASAVIQAGGGTTSCTSDALGAAATVTRRCMLPNTSDACPVECAAGTAPAAEIRKYNVHIYFVAPCSLPTGGGDICTGATDDSGNPMPTLKRLEITAIGGATSFKLFSIAEGVQYMKIEYGIDDTPATVNSDTGLVGDGSPDRYAVAPTLADFTNAVTVRIDLLMRNTSKSQGFTDTKVYNLGIDPLNTSNPYVSVGPFNDQYRRHVYASEVRLVNLSARKENP